MRTRKECSNGLSILKSLSFNPIVDNLNITFKDPIALSADLCKVQNRFAFQGRYQPRYDYRAQAVVVPVLYIDGQDMGTIDNLKIQAIKTLAEPPMVSDENIKKASEIKASRINLDLDLSQEVQVMAPMGHKIVSKLSKLVIYEKDGVFSEHTESQGENNFGTLILYLPVPYEGGNVILSDKGNELTLSLDQMVKQHKIPWISFYSDINHRIEVANSGVRMALHFNLTAEKYGRREEYGIECRIEGRYSNEPANRYRFKGYNEEIMSNIKSKLNAIFAQQKEKAVEESKKDELDEEEEEDVLQEDEEGKEEKEEEEEEEEEEDYEDEDEDEDNEKKNITIPDGIAIMLKRRYRKSSLSLKGSDSVLYNSLKDDFTVELRQVVLEQNRGYEFKEELIEIVAISRLDDLQESCSSEEELQVGQDNMRIPVKSNKKFNQNRGVKLTHQQKFGKKKNVCFVSGLPPQVPSKLVRRIGDENADNDHSITSYIHSALFIYPK